MGQQKAELDLRIGFSPALTPPEWKLAFAVLHDLDPGALISFANDGATAKYRSQQVADPATVRQALLDAGLQAQVSVNDAVSASSETRMLPASFPIYLDTGDPAADEATYQAAKEAWILAHPDLYEGLTLPAGAAGQPPTGQ